MLVYLKLLLFDAAAAGGATAVHRGGGQGGGGGGRHGQLLADAEVAGGETLADGLEGGLEAALAIKNPPKRTHTKKPKKPT